MSLKSLSKTIWPEFIRKMTILLLYDRANTSNLRPKKFKPHLIYPIDRSKEFLTYQKEEKEEENQNDEDYKANKINKEKFEPTPYKYQLTLPSIFGDAEPKDEKITNSIIDIKRIMARQVTSLKINQHEHFGSYKYVIQSNDVNNSRVMEAEKSDNVNEDNKDNDKVLGEMRQNLITNNKLPKLKHANSELIDTLNLGNPLILNKYQNSKAKSKQQPVVSVSMSMVNAVKERKNSRHSSNSTSSSQPINYFAYNKDFYRNYDRTYAVSSLGTSTGQVASIVNFKPKMSLLFSRDEQRIGNQQQAMAAAGRLQYKDDFHLPSLIEDTSNRNKMKVQIRRQNTN